MSRTPGTGDMRAAMRDAVQRSKGNKKQAQDSKARWKEAAMQRRKMRALLVLALLGPICLLALLYPLHTYGVFRLWKPAALSKALGSPGTTDKLDLTHQYLDEVPDRIPELVNLKTLILDSNSISKLDPSVFKLARLQNLSVQDDGLTELPPEIGELKELKELHLNNNKLSALPKEVFTLSQLEVLSAKDNALTTIPSDISKLKNLKVLNLKNNDISNVPEGISELSKLETLNLSGNKLSALPDLSGLPKLKQVIIRDTGVSPAEVDALKQRVGAKVSVNS